MRRISKTLSLLLCLAIVFTLCTPAFATDYSDTAGHWAESAIDRWSSYGIVEGREGAFDPDGVLTRGQMAKILADTLGLTEEAANPFADVSSDAWYTPYILRCYAANILSGDGVNANPDTPVTRQEAMVMLCRALDIAPAQDIDLSAYTDGNTVSDWAKPHVAAMVQSGIVSGVGNGQLAPSADISRGSMMAILDRSVVQYIDNPGTYELTDKDGIILVVSGNVTLTGETMADILVALAVNGKNVTFNKATVTGAITVRTDDTKIINQNSILPDINFMGKNSTVTSSTTSSGGGFAPPHIHSLTKVEAKEASCGEGNTTYWTCTCGKLFADEEGKTETTLAEVTIPGTGKHTWDGGTVTSEPTETVEGVITYTCVVCGAQKSEPIPSLNSHDVWLSNDKENGLCLNWKGSSEYYTITANDEFQASGTLKSPYSLAGFLFFNSYQNTTHTFSLKVYTGLYDPSSNLSVIQDMPVEIRLQNNDQAPVFSLVGQSNGHFKIVSTNPDAEYLYRIFDVDGCAIGSGYATNQEIPIFLTEEYTIDVCTVTTTISADQQSAFVTVSSIGHPTQLVGTSLQEVEVHNFKELNLALNCGGTVRLANDFYGFDLSIDHKVPVTLDLNGHTLAIDSINIGLHTSLTIDCTMPGSAIYFVDEYDEYIYTSDHSQLTIKGGVFETINIHHYTYTHCGYSPEVNIINSTFTKALSLYDCISSLTNLTVTSDCTYSIYGSSNTTINGGSYLGNLSINKSSLTITGGTFSFDPTEYVNSAAYTVTDNGNSTYTVTVK